MIFMEDIGFDIDERILRVLNGVASSREKASLDEWFQSSVEHEDYYRERVRDFQRIKMLVNITRAEDMKQQVCKTLNKAVRKQTKAKIRMSRRGWYKIAGMAAILIVGFMVRFHDKNTSHDHLLKQPIIYPGKSVATITLANGEELEVGNRGLNVREENGMFLKLDSTVITYSGKQADSGKVVYNTLTVPAGGEYRLVLSDGTKVWMNADSKLKYPVAFGQSQREVFLEGEAYFDVKKDPEYPFTVHTSRGDVQVLGTGFNIRDYRGEARVVTTLVEGKVVYKASERHEAVIILPGYQLIDNGYEELAPQEVDVEMYVGWKDGRYIFEDATLEEIMQVLSRWYDIAVFYKREEVKKLHFTGDLERYKTINDFLEFMEIGGNVRFSIKGKTVLIE